MNGEIISLQFGNYSNFVGAHFYNLQNPNELEINEDVDLNVWWQERRQGMSKLYSPRFIAVDLPENCVSNVVLQGLGLGKEATLKNNALLWEGQVEEIHVGPDGDAPGKTTNAVGAETEPRKFKDGTDCWTDLCRWRLLSGQVQKTPSFSHNPENKGMSSYSQGLEVWSQMEESLSDQIRLYAEDCDHLQGFHILVDQDDGISGTCAGVLQHLSDEYERKCCFGMGVSPPQVHLNGVKDAVFRNKVANVGLLWNRFSHLSTAFSSMSLSNNIFSIQSSAKIVPLWSYKVNSIYESSSVLAATLQNLWAPVATNPAISLLEISSFLSTFGRKMASICSSFPYPCDIRQSSLFGVLKDQGLASHISLTTCLSDVDFSKASGNYYVLKGFPDEVAITDKERLDMRKSHTDVIKDVNSCFTMFAQEYYCKSVNMVKNIKQPTRVQYPFPTNAITSCALESYYVKRQYTQGVLDIWDLPSIASAHNTSQNGIVLDNLIREIGGENTSKIHSFHSACNMDSELDDFLHTVEELSTLREQYDVKFE